MISKNQLKFHRQLELKKYRRQEGLFVAEGPKVVGDLLKAGFEVRQIYATPSWIADTCHHAKTQEVTEEELRKLSFLQHPQKVVAQFVMREATGDSRRDVTSGREVRQFPPENVSLSAREYVTSPQQERHLLLALDGVQDPGNLGTIIRIADWFGISTIYCSEDTADAWNPKVVQATMGSIARVNIIYCSLEQLLQTAQVPVYGTLLDGHNIYEEELSAEGIIVMGNEGNGISPRIRELVTHRLLIPQYHEGAESLNVAIATAITCAEFRRRFRP